MTDNKRVHFSNQIYEHKGLPLRSTGQFTLPSGTQKIINTKVAVSIPEEFHAQVELLWTNSRLEPWVAPGIILEGQGEIEILILNLSRIPMKVKKGQVIAFMHLVLNNDIKNIYKVGDFTDMGLNKIPDISVHSVITRDDLANLDKS